MTNATQYRIVSVGYSAVPRSRRPKYSRRRANGVTFVFKHEDDYPELLHIFARHRKTDEDAIFIFFEGTSTAAPIPPNDNVMQTVYNDAEYLWWYWIDEVQKVVMVVSCGDI